MEEWTYDQWPWSRGHVFFPTATPSLVAFYPHRRTIIFSASFFDYGMWSPFPLCYQSLLRPPHLPHGALLTEVWRLGWSTTNRGCTFSPCVGAQLMNLLGKLLVFMSALSTTSEFRVLLPLNEGSVKKNPWGMKQSWTRFLRCSLIGGARKQTLKLQWES